MHSLKRVLDRAHHRLKPIQLRSAPLREFPFPSHCPQPHRDITDHRIDDFIRSMFGAGFHIATSMSAGRARYSPACLFQFPSYCARAAIASARLAGAHAMTLNSADILPIQFASTLDSLEEYIRSTKSICSSHFDAKERKEDENDSRFLPPRNVQTTISRLVFIRF